MGQNRKKHRINSYLAVPRAREWAKRASEQTSERSRGREQSEQSGSSKRVSGVGERGNGRASGPVLTSGFLTVLDHSAHLATKEKWHIVTRKQQHQKLTATSTPPKKTTTKYEETKQNKNKSNRVRTTDAFSGELPTCLSLNRLLNGILSYYWCSFVRIRPISHKFNSWVTDGRTDTPSYRDARTHLI